MAKKFFTKLTADNLSQTSDRPQIKFELFGDWDKAMNVIKGLGPNIKKASVKAQLKVGNIIVRKVKAHIRNQDLGWKPLSPMYEMRKSGAGLNTNIMRAHDTYYDNIKVWQSGNRHLVNIGVKRGIYTKTISGRKSKLEVATIAAIHELSSGKRFPRRPLWNPTIKEMGSSKGIRKIFINSLVWHLRLYGVPVKQNGPQSLNINGSKVNIT